jgi:hypothetical protein
MVRASILEHWRMADLPMPADFSTKYVTDHAHGGSTLAAAFAGVH